MGNRHNVFVYGTLKRGQSNHDRFLSEAVFLGDASTCDDYALIDGAAFPWVIDPKDLGAERDAFDVPSCWVKGELYSVNDAELADLDRLEGHPTMYTRKLVGVVFGDNRTLAHAWVYFMNTNARDVARYLENAIAPDDDGFASWPVAIEDNSDIANLTPDGADMKSWVGLGISLIGLAFVVAGWTIMGVMTASFVIGWALRGLAEGR